MLCENTWELRSSYSNSPGRATQRWGGGERWNCFSSLSSSFWYLHFHCFQAGPVQLHISCTLICSLWKLSLRIRELVNKGSSVSSKFGQLLKYYLPLLKIDSDSLKCLFSYDKQNVQKLPCLLVGNGSICISSKEKKQYLMKIFICNCGSHFLKKL